MFRLILLLLLTAALTRPAAAYSVLTHQAQIDSCWRPMLVPALSARFPGATPEEWKQAKAHAYGGAIIQDMGYYPFGSHLFTNLTHYVRSGDFVGNLLLEARDRNEYAFALGALAHYSADIKGHREGINKVLPAMFPELKARFGPEVTYEEAPARHKQVEFAFDVVQLAAGRYRTEQYHDFIGFKVSKEALERSFLKTYGLALGQVTFNVDLSISSYRFAVQQLMPLVSRAAWRQNRQDIYKTNPRARRRDYVFRESRQDYARRYGAGYQRPGPSARLLAGLFQMLPKVGPLKPLKFKNPSPAAQEMFKASFRQVLADYGALVQAVAAGRPSLPNTDFDTGQPTKAGEYPLADETYGEWLRELASRDFKDATPAVQQNILTYFGPTPKTPADPEEKEADKRQKTQAALVRLRALRIN
ncbi:zinc dependent phospholipase C family protein [uncultured Hymenobacter sp.]|uniref:zinc dependent phospholipase C family protein n=1 Tax=uncultured Hymenobacter sp. TaxID=170016 RepID=UPI0035CAE603